MTKERTVLMENAAGHLGAISCTGTGPSATVRAYDSRLADDWRLCGIKSAVAVIPSPEVDGYMDAQVKVSEERGWRVFYDGPPLLG